MKTPKVLFFNGQGQTVADIFMGLAPSGFEADWKPVRDRRRAPGDPALLKHLGGPFYAVLATWDLTFVEQAVLGVTRN